MRIIHISITKVISLTDDVKRTCNQLLEIGVKYTELANSLQKYLLQVYNMIFGNIAEVWPNYLYDTDTTTETEVLLKANFTELGKEVLLFKNFELIIFPWF